MQHRPRHPDTGVSRLIAFTDGVVAIAITLIVLPLVDAAREDVTGADYLAKNSLGLLAALISFLVIANFWKIHHDLYDHVTGATRSLVNANLVWLAAIVFLPLPTVLIVASPGHDPVASALYVVTLIVASSSARIQETILVRNGLFAEGFAPSRRALRADWVVPGLLVVALIVTITIPATGLYPLLVGLLATPINAIVRRNDTSPRIH